jgi:amphi-Trp domain-containing protein
MTTDEYERDVTASREEIAAVMGDVADGIRSGAVRFGDGADAVTVDIPAEVALEIELETEDDGTSLELELEWTESDDDAPESAADAVEGSATAAPATDTTDEATANPSADDTAAETERPPVDDTPEATAAAAPADPEATAADRPAVGAGDGTRSMARFEVYRGRDGDWYWRLRHRNGNVIATGGEGYTRKHNALKGLRSVVANSADAAITGEFTSSFQPRE